MHGRIQYATYFFYASYKMQLRHRLSKYILLVLIGIKDKLDAKNDCL